MSTRWSSDEERKMSKAINLVGSEKNAIPAIAASVGTKSKNQVGRKLRRIRITSANERGNWTLDDDNRLREGMRNNISFKRLGRMLRRTTTQVKERWECYLDPAINWGDFSDQENALLLRLHNQIGNRWVELARRMPGRTREQVKKQIKLINDNYTPRQPGRPRRNEEAPEMNIPNNAAPARTTILNNSQRNNDGADNNATSMEQPDVYDDNNTLHDAPQYQLMRQETPVAPQADLTSLPNPLNEQNIQLDVMYMYPPPLQDTLVHDHGSEATNNALAANDVTLLDSLFVDDGWASDLLLFDALDLISEGV